MTHAVGCVSVRGRHQPARATSSAASESKDATSAVVQLTSEKEVNELLERCKRDGRKCVVNVSTSSCGPCKFLLPTFEKYAEEHRSTATFAKLVSDQNEELGAVASSWKVLQVPTYRMYDEKGEVSKQFTTGDPKKLGSSLYLFLAYQ